MNAIQFDKQFETILKNNNIIFNHACIRGVPNTDIYTINKAIIIELASEDYEYYTICIRKCKFPENIVISSDDGMKWLKQNINDYHFETNYIEETLLDIHLEQDENVKEYRDVDYAVEQCYNIIMQHLQIVTSAFSRP